MNYIMGYLINVILSFNLAVLYFCPFCFHLWETESLIATATIAFKLQTLSEAIIVIQIEAECLDVLCSESSSVSELKHLQCNV